METFCSQQNLCIYSKEYPYNEKWCWSGLKVVEEDLLYLKFDRENSRRFDLRKQFFRNLQKVYLYQIGDKLDCFLEEVHLLTKLKVLMVDDHRTTKLRKLSSASLEKFSFNSNFICIELDMSELHSFSLWNYFRESHRVSFRFPLALKHLMCKKFDSNLTGLKNLETLICEEITTDFRLKNFKRLTRLELFPFNTEQFELARAIREERMRLGRDNLEIVISGFKDDFVFASAHFPFAFLAGGSAYFEHAVQNYSHLVCRNPLKIRPYISDLPKWVSSIPGIPGIFFEKFPEIDSIGVYGREMISESEQSSLIELIRRSNTKTLSVMNLKLTNEFYEQVSSVLSIDTLRVGPHLENFDFDHFLRLRHLQQLFIRSEKKIRIEFICKLFEQLKFLVYFTFDSTCSCFKIKIKFHTILLEDLAEGEIIDFSRPYQFNYVSPLHLYGTIPRHCKDVDELVQEINRMKEDPALMDLIN